MNFPLCADEVPHSGARLLSRISKAGGGIVAPVFRGVLVVKGGANLEKDVLTAIGVGEGDFSNKNRHSK